MDTLWTIVLLMLVIYFGAIAAVGMTYPVLHVLLIVALGLLVYRLMSGPRQEP